MNKVITNKGKFFDKTYEMPLTLETDTDVLIEVEAVSINPHDVKALAHKSADQRVLGFDAVGKILKLGSLVDQFKVGDRVIYAGSDIRDGSFADYQVVDSRLISKIEDSASVIDYAAVPLVAITAYEILFDKLAFKFEKDSNKGKSIFVLNGAGGVGSLLTQLANWAGIKVYATSSKRNFKFLEENGVTNPLDYSEDFAEQIGENKVDATINLYNPDYYLQDSIKVTHPFGHLVYVTVGNSSIHNTEVFSKSLTIDYELMFTKSMYGYKQETQGLILKNIIGLIKNGEITSRVESIITDGINAKNLNYAAKQLRTGHQRGKIIILKN
ncbi:alcohol dehydrogenase catalytic domain-containing protein [Weissella muntiaci]|nr:zinc-binding dehydrogenase [Weissella muntiaci]